MQGVKIKQIYVGKCDSFSFNYFARFGLERSVVVLPGQPTREVFPHDKHLAVIRTFRSLVVRLGRLLGSFTTSIAPEPH